MLFTITAEVLRPFSIMSLEGTGEEDHGFPGRAGAGGELKSEGGTCDLTHENVIRKTSHFHHVYTHCFTTDSAPSHAVSP